MKNNIIYITGIIVLSIFTSCSKKLDINPITSRAATTYYSTEKEMESAVIGAYAQLQNPGLYGLDLIGVGEIPGEDTFEEIAANDGGRFGQLDDFSTNAENDLVNDIWRESYEGILRTNTVLGRIGAIAYEDEAVKNSRIGEMQFVRALLYFNLVRLYGDVPLVIKETENPILFFGQGRTPAEQVWEQIEDDLKKAIQNLPVEKESGRPAKGAAKALLADVYMNRGNNNEAVILLSEVVNSGKYILMPSTADVFSLENEGNQEILFEVQYASGINGNSEGERAASQFRPSGTTANAKGHNLPSEDFVGLYEEGDTRATHYVGIDAEANPFYFSTKYVVSPTGANDGESDHIIIRYADVLLKYAEALNETGQTNQAVTYLNMVRNRAGLDHTAVSSQPDVRAAIEMERRFELIGEGHRWFDLKRTGKAASTMNAWFESVGKPVVIDENKLVLPIPQSQIDTDPAIVQNPGY